MSEYGYTYFILNLNYKNPDWLRKIFFDQPTGFLFRLRTGWSIETAPRSPVK